ncbi:putative cold-shock DNA-binding protein [Rhodobacter aestuarii]|uniref:Cold-shock DNA-binding protein family n=1 Tax=Rhodobacter aestuarii TaxID=453582 RepID=A0A1N7NPP2_9RHOB|nr:MULTISPECIES: cold shock domain-containing protein [Rhodobacter]PTV94639.1 putative cold-shock DNA-binding protein [Rhodobacter aestuarii]SIT00208.1 cold-shock DNA-binding protein family [Rhodobacter aestuarii]SOC12932.1 putative cold-shock DNA-binding protein [Rhodobacter sp. JA431]
MVETESTSREVSGRVKWFDAGKGFGFILDGEGGPDILLHANVLRNFGQGSVADNAGIRVIVQATPRGAQAIEVLEISPPDPETRLAPIEDLGDADPAMVAELPLEPARVKWFDKAKGFGFANVFARPEDVFIHVEVLRRSGFADLAPGEAVCLRVIEGRRGRMAAQVISWEVALRP